jgi:GH18 family chitinase
MTYDYHDKFQTSIGAPLIQDGGKVTYKETIAENLNKILQEDCSPEKLILGISNYGRIYRLNRSTKSHLGAIASELKNGNEVVHGTLNYNIVRTKTQNNEQKFLDLFIRFAKF